MKNLVIKLLLTFLILSFSLSGIAQSKEEKKAQIEKTKTELRASLKDENATVDFLKAEVKRVESLKLKNGEIKFLLGEMNRRIKKTESLTAKENKESKTKAENVSKPEKIKTEKPKKPEKVKAEKPEKLKKVKAEKTEKPKKVKAEKSSKAKSVAKPDSEKTETKTEVKETPITETDDAKNLEFEKLAKEKELALEAEQLEEKKQLNRIFNEFTLNANADVETILEYFANEDVPVLIKISEANGKSNYDKPTTIRKYLEYLKDQSKNLNYIETISFNDNNLVTELVLARTNVAIKLSEPEITDSPSLKGSLSPIRKMAVDSLALEKVRDLGKYIHIIGSKNTPFSEANRAVERAAELFEQGSTMEVSSTTRNTIKSYPIKEYFNRLMTLNYDQVDITWTEIKYLDNLELLPNGKYMGVITTYQYFEGKSGGQLVYKDKTVKDVTVYVEGKQTQIGGRLVDFWDVLLGDVKVAESSDLTPPKKD